MGMMLSELIIGTTPDDGSGALWRQTAAWPPLNASTRNPTCQPSCIAHEGGLKILVRFYPCQPVRLLANGNVRRKPIQNAVLKQRYRITFDRHWAGGDGKLLHYARENLPALSRVLGRQRLFVPGYWRARPRLRDAVSVVASRVCTERWPGQAPAIVLAAI
jgi:hypothetical protein